MREKTFTGPGTLPRLVVCVIHAPRRPFASFHPFTIEDEDGWLPCLGLWSSCFFLPTKPSANPLRWSSSVFNYRRGEGLAGWKWPIKMVSIQWRFPRNWVTIGCSADGDQDADDDDECTARCICVLASDPFPGHGSPNGERTVQWTALCCCSVVSHTLCC